MLAVLNNHSLLNHHHSTQKPFMNRLKTTMLALIATLSVIAQDAIYPIVPNTPGNTSKIYKYTPNDGGILYTMTRGNEWAIINQGRVDGDEEHVCPTQLFNMNTGQLIPVMFQGRQIHVTMASNDGNILVGNYSDRAVSINREKGTMTVYPNRPLWHGGHLTDCTPDGRYAVGYYQGYLGKPDDNDLPNDWYYRTLLVDTQTGDTLATPGIPKTKRNGQKYQSIKFTGISNDGRYITGAIDWYIEGSMSFIYDRIEDKVVSGSFLSLYHGDIAKKFDGVVSVSGSMVSPSMTAFGCRVTKRKADGTTFSCNGVYFADRDTLVTYDYMEDGGVSISAIDDNGTYYGVTDGNMTPLRNFKILYDGKYWVSLNQLCQQRFGYDFNEVTGFERSGTIMGVSPDGHKVISFADPMGESFCIDFGMTANEACSTIDFLSNYKASPESGSQFESLKSVEITFDRPIRIVGSGKNIHLLDSNGNEVATGLSTASALQFKSNSTTCVIATIRTRTLTPGQRYTFVIDAGTFATEKSGDCASKEIRIEYTGRSGPVQMTSVAPEAGSALMKFDNQSSYAIVSFDCKVRLTDDPYAYIQREDGSIAGTLTMVAGSADNTKHQVLLYPAGVVNLYDGQRYKIVIEEGSLTDYASGSNSKNKRIEIEYVGTYIRPVPTGRVLFQDSWDDIAESLNTWLRYEGDHNTPRSTPSSWDFDADNQPWNFSIRESNENPDYCAGSHSMYAPSGTSDDWMMTPQIAMPADGKTVLEFDAQNYSFDASDVLDVYVYEDERVISYLNDNNMAVIKPNAVKVFSEALTPGETLEGLANEWTHYVVDLSAWNGKDIYVAFVNQNYNKSAIFVDNVFIQRETQYSLALDYEEQVVAADEQKISGKLIITTDKPVTSIRLTLHNQAGDEIDKIEWGSISGDAKGRVLPFVFGQNLPLKHGEDNKYAIDVAINDRTETYNGVITNLSFKPVKRVVLEEMTGVGCPNCPLGIVTIEKLRKMWGDRFIPVSLHTYTGDPYGSGVIEYSNSLGLNAAPSARINRTKGLYYPMRSSGSQYFDTDASNPLWIDIVATELGRPALCDFNVFACYTDETKKEVRYSADVKYALTTDNQQLSLLFVVLEDGIMDYQQNAFSSVESPLLGEWGKGGQYAVEYVYPYVHNDVARSVVGSNFAGTIGLLPASFVSGETVSASVVQPFPTTVSNAANAHVVGMLINTQTGEVVNAAHCTISDRPSDGIRTITTSAPADGIMYNLQGQRIASPTPGKPYIVGGRKYVK